MLKKLACIIPCFNESKNLPYLCREIELINEEFIDWFIINNGSYDINHKQFETIVRANTNSSNVNTFFIITKTRLIIILRLQMCFHLFDEFGYYALPRSHTS